MSTVQGVAKTFIIGRFLPNDEYRLQKGKAKLPNEFNARVGLYREDQIFDLTDAGVSGWVPLMETPDLVGELVTLAGRPLKHHEISGVYELPAVDPQQEVIAAGVTYDISRRKRNLESTGSEKPPEPSDYDTIAMASRGEYFRKTDARKVVGHVIGFRQKDSDWNVVEPEIVVGFNSRGELVCHKIGNDVSSRRLEGTNKLYLWQAKDYLRSCSVGSHALVGVDEKQAKKEFVLSLEIKRDGKIIYNESTPYNRMERSYENLRDYLFLDNEFPYGVDLFTGTGLVPENFTLQTGDEITIAVPQIGKLVNTAVGL